MIEIRQTPTYAAWFSSLRDRVAKARIVARIDRMQAGLRGDWRAVGRGVFELRVDYGPGYRVYYVQHGTLFIVLLAGGDKSSQARDISAAKKLASEL